MEKKLFGKVTSVVLAAVMACTLSSGIVMADESTTESEITLSGPCIEKDSAEESGQKVTWDCVTFGSYPQTEIVDKAETSGVYRKLWEKAGDYVVDADLYNELISDNITWNDNNDTTIDGTKYHRICVDDATYHNSISEVSDFYYNWETTTSTTYHYFRYDPIKWRVLSNDDGVALLLSDVVLDDQTYHLLDKSIKWKDSSIRDWLNSYQPLFENPFIYTAFTKDERDAIEWTEIVTEEEDTVEGNSTNDMIFLLSEADVDGDNAVKYGFTGEAERIAQSSTYAKAMGTINSISTGSIGNSRWWLRSSSSYNNEYAANVTEDGDVNDAGYLVNSNNIGVRPALRLKLSSSDVYSFAGTVCSDGTVDENGQAHTVKDYVSNGDATCTKDGTKTGICEVCGETLTVIDVGSATGHTPAAAVKEKLDKATITKAGGYDMVVRCATCNEPLSSKHVTVAKLKITTKKTKATYKYAKVKKKAKTFKIGATVNSKGTLSYKVTKYYGKAKMYLKLNKKTGKITVKKGTPKGTYKIKVKITAKAKGNYAKGSVTKTITVKVK